MRLCVFCMVFCFRQKTEYEMRISDWSSDVCSSDLIQAAGAYDDEGRLVGQFRLSGTPPPKTGRLIPPLIVDRDLIVTARVAQGDTSLGSVYLRSSLERWPRRGLRYLGIALLVLMASLLIAVLVSSYASLREAHAKLRAEIRNREKAEEALRQSQNMDRSEEHTSELQSLMRTSYAVFCLKK